MGKERRRPESVQIETYRRRNDSRQFYKKLKKLCTGSMFQKHKDENLIADVYSKLELWRDHLTALQITGMSGVDKTNKQIMDVGIDCPPFDRDDVQIKLQAELYKTRDDELINNIWSYECMPGDWTLSGKCDDFAYYRGVSLLSIAYKVLSIIICKRRKPLIVEQTETYELSFRTGKSTADQILFLEKTNEKEIYSVC